MGNLGNVAMVRCARCWEAYSLLLQKREWLDIFKWEKAITDWLCDKCEKEWSEAAAKGVTFHCDSCKQTFVIAMSTIKERGLKIEAGAKHKIYKCHSCTGDGHLELLPPNMLNKWTAN